MKLHDIRKFVEKYDNDVQMISNFWTRWLTWSATKRFPCRSKSIICWMIELVRSGTLHHFHQQELHLLLPLFSSELFDDCIYLQYTEFLTDRRWLLQDNTIVKQHFLCPCPPATTVPSVAPLHPFHHPMIVTNLVHKQNDSDRQRLVSDYWAD